MPLWPDVEEWVRYWRYCHRLDDGLDDAIEVIRELLEPAMTQSRRVSRPLFMLTMRGSDLARGEAIVREYYRRELEGDKGVLCRQRSQEPQTLVVRETLTTAEVAKMLGRSESTIRKWRLEGKGPAFHKMTHGRSGGVYYLRDEVLEWLRSP